MAFIPSFLDGFRVPTKAFEEHPSLTIYEEFQRQVSKPENSDIKQLPYITEPCGRQISYVQLDEMVQRLAGRVKSLAKACRDPVAVFLRPGTHRIASLLALNSLRVPLVPLDVVQTADQRSYIIKHSQAQAIITDNELHKVLGESTFDAKVLLLEGDCSPTTVEGSDATEDVSCKDKDVCLTLFTSGSTGIPKGVMLTDANLFNRLRWQWCELPFARDGSDVCIAKTNHLFVDCYTELLGPILKMQQLVIADPNVWKESGDVASQLAQTISKHKVTRLVLVPSLLRALLDLPDAARLLASLRVMVSSGEALPGELAREFFRALSGSPSHPLLANFYGSTEVTGDITAAIFASEDDVLARTIDGLLSIGRPVHNTTVYVLNQETREPTRCGEVGEIFVSGDNVCKGFAGSQTVDRRYFKKPVLLQEVGCGDRLLAMGDIGKVVPGGELFFCGRSDSIVKIRGNRLSTVQVEDAMKKLLMSIYTKSPPVSKQAPKFKILAIQHRQSSTYRLAAFYEKWPEASNELRPDNVRNQLSKHLAYYAVPELIFPFEMGTFPLQPATGKTDLRALKQLAETSSCKALQKGKAELAGIVVTKSDLKTAEKAVRLVTATVLGVPEDTVVIDATFFDLGGNSLSVIAAVQALKNVGYLNASAEQLLEPGKTLGDIARHLNETFQTAESERKTEFAKPEWLEYKDCCDLSEDETNYVCRRIDYTFMTQEPLAILLQQPIGDILDLIYRSWPTYLSMGPLAFIAIDRRRSGVESIVGACLNADHADPENESNWVGLEDIMAILAAAEEPIHEEFLRQYDVETIPRGLILSNRMMYTDADLPREDAAQTFMSIEMEQIARARAAGYKTIVTANSSVITQKAEELLGYKERVAVYANKFKTPDGKMPYLNAQDDYAVRGMTLDLQ